jgi:DNA-directed RNA polymerase specialized sigma24 family protein
MTASSFHREFELLLPKIKEAARFSFRGLNPIDRDEAVADLIAATWSAWSGLIKRGRSPLEVGPIGILNFAVKYVRNGRRVGNPGSGRGRMDLWNHRAQRALGFRLISLGSARREGALRSWVANDHRSTPADHAAFLLDFREWLDRLPERRRTSAELLSQGYGTKEVADQLGVTPGAISQARTALARNWDKFQQDRTA